MAESGEEMAAEVAAARERIRELESRLQALEDRFGKLPDIRLLSPSFMTRAVAILGYLIWWSVVVLLVDGFVHFLFD